MKRHQMRLMSAMIAAATGLLTSVPAAHAVVVTFSGLHNGINSATDPEDNNTPDSIPAAYQPLLNAYPAPNSNTDGGNIGVMITWTHANIAAQPFGGVFDHTAMAGTDNAEELIYGNGATIDIKFDQPVLIPSFWYANYSAGDFHFQVQGFTNAGDDTAAYDSGSLA